MIVLTVICICVALALGITNALTVPVIERANAEKTAKLLRQVYPQSESFEPIDPDAHKGKLPESIIEIYLTEDGGFIFKSKVKGFKPDLTILVGIDPTGAVTDTKYLQSSETLSAEDSLDGKYAGATADGFSPEIISGATYTSEGYAQAVSDSLSAFKIMKGGSDK